MPDGTRPPDLFCKSAPKVQRAWDSHSLGMFRECPRKYQYAILEGWRHKRMKPSLQFGIAVHSAMEVWHKARAEGKSKDDSVLEAVGWALENMGEHQWHCKNCQGVTSATSKCANCGGKTKRTWVPWMTNEPARNIVTLCRAIVWYSEQFEDDTVRTLVLENGKAAVEHSFRLPLSINTPDGDAYILCGHIDVLGLYGSDDDCFVKEHKHTVRSFSKNYFDQFTPHTQVSCYSFSSKIVLGTPAKGVVIDAIQIGVNFVRFQRQFAHRTPAVLEEWLDHTMWWIKQAESCADQDHWPMNDMSCDKYGGCQFRPICQKDPAVRHRWLKADFKKEFWNPLKNRDT